MPISFRSISFRQQKVHRFLKNSEIFSVTFCFFIPVALTSISVVFTLRRFSRRNLHDVSGGDKLACLQNRTTI